MENLDCKDNSGKQATKRQLGWLERALDLEPEVTWSSDQLHLSKEARLCITCASLNDLIGKMGIAQQGGED